MSNYRWRCCYGDELQKNASTDQIHRRCGGELKFCAPSRTYVAEKMQRWRRCLYCYHLHCASAAYWGSGCVVGNGVGMNMLLMVSEWGRCLQYHRHCPLRVLLRQKAEGYCSERKKKRTFWATGGCRKGCEAFCELRKGGE